MKGQIGPWYEQDFNLGDVLIIMFSKLTIIDIKALENKANIK